MRLNGSSAVRRRENRAIECGEQRLWFGFEGDAANSHPTVGANELRGITARLEGHFHAVTKLEFHVPIIDDVVKTRCRNHTRPLDRHRTGDVGIAAPNHDVQRMGAPAAQIADRIVVNPIGSRRMATIGRKRSDR